MIRFKYILVALFSIILFQVSFAQKSQKEIERENNKVTIFSYEEKDNLQLWLHEQVDKMEMTDELENNYYEVLSYYSHSIGRLNDKDKDYSKEEQQIKFHELVDNMNDKMKSILSPEQYTMHLETFNKIIYSINRKLNWDKN